MTKASRAAVLPINLPYLQSLIKADPKSYVEEFQQQWKHFSSLQRIVASTTFVDADAKNNSDQHLCELINFLCQTANLYSKDTSEFPFQVVSLLEHAHTHNQADLRTQCLRGLLLLKSRQMITSTDLARILINALKQYAKSYQPFLKEIEDAILTLIQRDNSAKLTKYVQNLFFELINEDTDSEINLAIVKITRELWRKRVWANDSKAVELMRQICLKCNGKPLLAATHFFLGHIKPSAKGQDGNESDYEKMSSDDESNSQISVKQLLHQSSINKKTKSRQRIMARLVAQQKRQDFRNAANSGGAGTSNLNFAAIQLISDSQGFIETMFSKHVSNSRTRLSGQNRLLILQLISRLIGSEQLTLLNFYSFMLKYISPKIRDVTKYLACLVQAVHPLVPPDTLTPVVLKIANEFVTSGVSTEVVTVGINCIREICARQPLAISKELLEDLVAYKGSKDKGVNMAARSLITLFRDIAPGMLPKKEQGRPSKEKTKAELPSFGINPAVVTDIDGLELLAEEIEKKSTADDLANDGFDSWEVASSEEDDDSDGEWITVNHDHDNQNDLVISSSSCSSSDDDDDDDESNQNDSVMNIKETDTIESELDEDSEMSKNEEDDEDSNTEDSDGMTDGDEDVDISMEDNDDQSSSDQKIIPKINLATEKILTPADLLRLKELRAQSLTSKNVLSLDDAVERSQIEGPRRKIKNDREARLESVKRGREGRDKFGSKKGQQKEGKSTTNREKNRNKAFMMTLNKRRKGSKGRSLVQNQKRLRQHVARSHK